MNMNSKKRQATRQSDKAKQAMSNLSRLFGATATLCALSIILQSDDPVAVTRYVAADSASAVSELPANVDRNQAVSLDDASSERSIAAPVASIAAARSADSSTNAAYAAEVVGPPRNTQPAGDDTTPPKAARQPHEKMSGPVAALAANGGSGMVEIVVRYTEFPALFDDEFVATLGGEVTRSYKTLDMRAIRIPANALLELASDDKVDWLSVDDDISFTSVASRGAANVPAVGSAFAGYHGSNVGIAVLDTGVAEHADLDPNIVQYSFLNGAYPVPDILNGEVTALNDDPREDLFGHGTHVAGILTGSGAESDDDFKGSATSATVLSLQVLDRNGGGSMSDVMAALDWLLVYGNYFDIRVVNLSLGKGISESNTTDPLVLAVEDLWDAGFVAVVAAGNEGNAGSMTITSPGNSRKVITVGSLTDNGTGADFTDDYVSSFSSTGPTIGDLVLKPDLVAPGNRIVATITSDAKLANKLPGRVKNCKESLCTSIYLEMSGTSMATPMTSAAVALMLDKDPTLSPATVKARLMRSARKIDSDASTAGAGVLDVEAALGDTGVMTQEALSPLMVLDESTSGVLVQDTALLWGDDQWGSGYLFSDGFTWATGYGWTDENGVSANGYAWTDANVWAKGYGWTDEDISAKGYGWTDGVDAKSLVEGEGEGEGEVLILNDDTPAQ